jgi:hypothetical protein
MDASSIGDQSMSLAADLPCVLTRPVRPWTLYCPVNQEGYAVAVMEPSPW